MCFCPSHPITMCAKNRFCGAKGKISYCIKKWHWAILRKDCISFQWCNPVLKYSKTTKKQQLQLQQLLQLFSRMLQGCLAAERLHLTFYWHEIGWLMSNFHFLWAVPLIKKDKQAWEKIPQIIGFKIKCKRSLHWWGVKQPLQMLSRSDQLS